MKKIGLLCLCLASLSLTGCFHIPDEEWLLSSDKAETGDVKNDEMDEALNSLMDGINMISSDWNDLKNNESDEINTDDGSENTIKEETINDEEAVDDTETTDNKVENEEVEEDITPEE